MRSITAAHITTVDVSLRYLLLNQLKSIQDGGFQVTGISSQGPDVPVIEAAGKPIAKNPLALVSAVSKLSAPGAELVFVGSGRLRSKVEESAHSLGVSARFLGTLPNSQSPEIMRACDLFALPSLWEGRPKSPIEAMSCGMAVIAYDSPGVNTVITHGVNGCLYAPDPDSLAVCRRNT